MFVYGHFLKLTFVSRDKVWVSQVSIVNTRSYFLQLLETSARLFLESFLIYLRAYSVTRGRVLLDLRVVRECSNTCGCHTI